MKARAPAADAVIRLRDRRTGLATDEPVYGERWLRWAYGTPAGRVAMHLVAKRPIFSKFYGWRMSRPSSRALIAPFVRDYGIATGDFLEPEGGHPDFNSFFTRPLRPGARPVDPDPARAILPADGRHRVVAPLSADTALEAKNLWFDLAALLGGAAEAGKFAGGAALVSRLAPVDYHRFHFPVAGVPSAPRLLKGPLFSVSPVALAVRPGILWENQRVVTLIDSDQFGPVAMVEIGATCVGSVIQTFRPGRAVKRGAEKGLFRFGGSCVVVLMPPGFTPDEDLATASRDGWETLARVGEGGGG